MIRLLFRIASILFVVWIIVSVFLGILLGIANMPYEDGPIDGCNNLKETVHKVRKDLKNAWAKDSKSLRLGQEGGLS
jgi:hypothetical protein